VKQRALYFVKNYHPAHAGILYALEAGGYEPTLVVAEPGRPDSKAGSGLYPTEPVHIPPGRISQLLFRPGAKSKYVREVPQIRALVRIMAHRRPALTLVYERSVRSSVTAWVAFLAGSEVVQVLDAPSLRLKSKSARHVARLPHLWLRHFLSPRLRMHSGGLGEEVGKCVPLGPFLGTSMLAPYPVFVDSKNVRVRRLESPLRVVCVAGSNPDRANHDFVLRAIAPLVQQEQASITFLLWPTSADAQIAVLRATESELRLRESDVQVGVPTRDLHEFLKPFDIMIYSSARGTYGHAISVALTCGLPVICSEKVGAKTLIRDGVNGFTYHPDDLLRLRKIVGEMIRSGDTVALLSQQAMRLADRDFSPHAWLAHLDSLRPRLRKPSRLRHGRR